MYQRRDCPSAHYNVGLLPAGQSDRVDVVLVSPRNPLNTGAAARAMANFGFSRLAVVAPYAPHWREAQSAVGAPHLLQQARECATLAEALTNCTLAVGTGTLRSRQPKQPVVPLPALAPLILQELACGGRVALVFGPEKHGLTRDDLAHCHLHVEIPTHPEQPSMNLGQAVAVCLYELATLRPSPDCANPDSTSSTTAGQRTTSGNLDRLSELIEETMRAAGYSPRVMQAANRHDLRLTLRRLHLNPADTRRLFGLFRRILWRLARGGDSPTR
ncbi:MAG: RNA methyltransferase [Terracidiphilus sp.]